ncbi:MAG: NAD(P)(+) transhydrogenase (Re/Si-specific) subunit beta [Calditrichaceae bacterium]|nr:NAD(P)(+) transhydrogenase (Re/Si-specific) subunit beta [Calditrichaceae bacterium]MBN2707787.1 NAD(P)(+) transhydrogenase (Re/Si-specific) subunit beta [Calditrichaceae bacterium]RQV96287.1 MAG: NAD(P)(+) transhydrogenase (Re/Si-specific) subunit beta [Calditrichota bacterium]
MVTITNIVYLIAAIFFIIGLKNLGSPKTARQGNLLAMTAMLIAVLVTLLDRQILDFSYIIAGVIIGAAIGIVSAKKVEMTQMPQMVAIFNGFGGIASALVAFSEYLRTGNSLAIDGLITLILSLIIGTLTFTGSLVAFAKLQGIMRGAPIVFPGQKWINAILLTSALVLGVFVIFDASLVSFLLIIVIIAAVLGVLSVIPIGGADMPVVISLLNSYSGLAAAATGFVLSNNILIISGALVGASGIILTQIMCKAMNRSLTNVLFAAVGTDDSGGVSTGGERKKVTEYTAEDAAMVFDASQSLIIIPGYGLAVAQAQHILQELAELLENRGVAVRYAIHPVAGRMPGHMNVLLAEANVPYEKLLEMDEINDDFQNTDVVLVIGANDVINPAARYKKDSALYGMPILNADKAKTVMIVKRSLSPGFAGEDNELFYDSKTMMLFGDAKKMVTDLVKAVKDL